MPGPSRRRALALAAVAPFGLAAAASRIDDAGFVQIGGIDQWIGVRGDDADAPVMLILHGGPGEALSPFRDMFRPYEREYIVALWDQRGAGKTYGRSGGDKTPGMTPEQFIRDGVEVAEHLRHRFGKDKIVLVGQSWGAALGLHMAKRRPDLFHAFVGTGQPVSPDLSARSVERFARDTLKAKGDKAGLKALDDALSLPPTDPKRRSATRAFLFGAEDGLFLHKEETFTGPKPWPKTGDVADWIGGYLFTSDALVPKGGGYTLEIVDFEFQAPFVVIQGKDDHITPTDVARDYVAKVRAPHKAFAVIRGGHFAAYTDPEGFGAALRRYVRPLCKT